MKLLGKCLLVLIILNTVHGILNTPVFAMDMGMPMSYQGPTQTGHVLATTSTNLNLPPNLPLCASIGIVHDRTKWHSLVHFQNSEDPNDPNRGAPICHWDHQHGQNPNAPEIVNSSVTTPQGTFTIGPAGVFSNGQTISYPWQTFKTFGQDPAGYPTAPTNVADLENGFKHNFYAWLVRPNAPCTDNQQDVTGCIKAFRWIEHADLSYIGAMSRFHSFWTEAIVCTMDANHHGTNDCGLIRTGGWIDYGHLYVNIGPGEGANDPCIPVPGQDPPNDPSCLFPGKRLHEGVVNGVLGSSLGGGRNGDVTWYGSTKGIFGDGFNGLGYGPVNPNNPGQKLLYSDFGKPQFNGSMYHAEVYGFKTPYSFNSPNVQIVNGHATTMCDPVKMICYTDRYGNFKGSCVPTDLPVDCVPFQLINIPINTAYQYRDSYDSTPGDPWFGPSHDITPPGIPGCQSNGQNCSWIVYNDTYVPDSPSASFEIYSTRDGLQPTSGATTGSGNYAMKLYCQPDSQGHYIAEGDQVNSFMTGMTDLSGNKENPYLAHLHYTSGIGTSGSSIMAHIIPMQDFRHPPFPDPTFLPTLIVEDPAFGTAGRPWFTQSERDTIRLQPPSSGARPGTWINVHTLTYQGGALQGDMYLKSGSCATSSPNPYDINKDNKVDILDLARIVNARTSATIDPYSGPEDVNPDGKLNQADLAAFFGQYTHL